MLSHALVLSGVFPGLLNRIRKNHRSQRTLWLFLGLALTLVVTASPGFANQNEAANESFVKAVQLIKKAEQADRLPERIDLYRQALKLLDEIVAAYPGSDVAVHLITDQPIGSFYRPALKLKLEDAMWESCFSFPSGLCLRNLTTKLLIGMAKATAKKESSFMSLYISGFISESPMWGKWVDQKVARRSLPMVRAFGEAIQYKPDKVAIYLEIAGAEAADGKMQTALSTLSHALDVAKSIPDSKNRSTAIQQIAIPTAELGKTQMALNLLSETLKMGGWKDDKKRTAEIYIDIAKNHGRDGKKKAALKAVELALKIARAFSPKYDVGILVVRAAEVYIQVGKKEAALALLQRAMDMSKNVENSYQDALLSVISQAQMSAGVFDKAVATVELIRKKDQQIYTLTTLAKNRAKVGLKQDALRLIEKARGTVKRISDKNIRVLVLLDIARAQARLEKLGDAGLSLEKAFRLASNLAHKEKRLERLTEIAAEQGRMGFTQKALRTIAEILKTFDRSPSSGGSSKMQMYAKLAKAQLLAGNVSAALRSCAMALQVGKKFYDQFIDSSSRLEKILKKYSQSLALGDLYARLSKTLRETLGKASSEGTKDILRSTDIILYSEPFFELYQVALSLKDEKR